MRQLMKKIKTRIALLMAITTLFSAVFVACGEKSDGGAGNELNQEIPLPDSSSGTDLPPSFDNDTNTDTDTEITPPSTPEPTPTPKPEVTPTPNPVSTKAQYIRCTGNSVNFRSGAGTDFAVVGSAEKNTTYAVLGKVGNWYKTYYRNKVAYISASFVTVVTMEKTSDKVEKVLLEGYKLLGVPYVYGAVRLHDGKGNLSKGFSAQKFDCSSLVQYIFYQGAGKNLQVTTRTQVKQGTFVKKSDLKRGDCIFFTNEERQYKTGIERVGHVAIYLGDNYILHTASDYARIEKISTKRWGFYIEARRFV